MWIKKKKKTIKKPPETCENRNGIHDYFTRDILCSFIIVRMSLLRIHKIIDEDF